VAHLRLEELELALPARLGRVHRDVGIAHHLLRPDLGMPADCDPDARADDDLHRLDLERLLEPLADPPGDSRDLVEILDPFEQDGEFVSCEAGERVPRPHA